MPNTADQSAADKLGRAIDGQIFRLTSERAILVAGPARIMAIDAEVAILQTEKARIDPRRPPVLDFPPNIALSPSAKASVDLPVQARVKSAP